MKVCIFKVGKFVGRFEISISFYLCVSNLVPIGENRDTVQRYRDIEKTEIQYRDTEILRKQRYSTEIQRY